MTQAPSLHEWAGGGTAKYGGYEEMVSYHRDLDITSEQRLRFVTLMSQAADDAELPGDPEFRAALSAISSGGQGWRCRILGLVRRLW